MAEFDNFDEIDGVDNLVEFREVFVVVVVVVAFFLFLFLSNAKDLVLKKFSRHPGREFELDLRWEEV